MTSELFWKTLYAAGGIPTGSMSPFVFFCAPPAAVRLEASDSALFICVAFPRMMESLFGGPAKVEDTALSKTRLALEVRPGAPENICLS